jgi:DNA-binding transcriptional LysR family regulator
MEMLIREMQGLRIDTVSTSAMGGRWMSDSTSRLHLRYPSAQLPVYLGAEPEVVVVLCRGGGDLAAYEGHGAQV